MQNNSAATVCYPSKAFMVQTKHRMARQVLKHTVGMAGLQTGTMLPDMVFSFWLMYSRGRGPTMRWIKSMLFRKGGTTTANLPKLSARLCSTRDDNQAPTS